MATLIELMQCTSSTYLRERLVVAVAVQAELVRTEPTNTPNHANRMLWAKGAFSDPRAMADKMLWAVLAQNRTATVQQITQATDAEVQGAVGAAVDVYATG